MFSNLPLGLCISWSQLIYIWLPSLLPEPIPQSSKPCPSVKLRVWLHHWKRLGLEGCIFFISHQLWSQSSVWECTSGAVLYTMPVPLLKQKSGNSVGLAGWELGTNSRMTGSLNVGRDALWWGNVNVRHLSLCRETFALESSSAASNKTHIGSFPNYFTSLLHWFVRNVLGSFPRVHYIYIFHKQCLYTWKSLGVSPFLPLWILNSAVSWVEVLWGSTSCQITDKLGNFGHASFI